MTITMSLGKVLLVDDDPATLELVKLALRDYRLDFDIAKEGLSALDLIEAKNMVCLSAITVCRMFMDWTSSKLPSNKTPPARFC